MVINMKKDIDLYAEKISYLLYKLADLACKSGICRFRDKVYALNRAIDVCGISALKSDFENILQGEDIDYANLDSINLVVEKILDLAFENKLIEENNDIYRDLFTAKLMDCFTMSPSEVENQFYDMYNQNPICATDFYYKFSVDTQYIKMDRVAKNRKWKADTKYGKIDITINLAKPEKDPKTIEKLSHIKSETYPLCLLCKENEGYAGGLHHPARQNHRIIGLELLGEMWYMQYSPYVYYNEHCIVFKDEHEPMQITYMTFRRLLEFATIFPHYFIGSNADLPIVGGSILTHDHFQGGKYDFAMNNAKVVETFTMKGFCGVQVQSLVWPLSVVRLRGEDRDELAKAADHIFETWKVYEDLERDIVPFSYDDLGGFNNKKIRHNTVTPIARRRGNLYELDIVLRNNRTSDEHPLGIFHPHSDVHNIKKENIGLIEVLGLAVLPARLQSELNLLAQYWVDNIEENCVKFPQNIMHHRQWFDTFSHKNEPRSLEEANKIIEMQVSECFVKVLEYAGVFKQTEFGRRGMDMFLNIFR